MLPFLISILFITASPCTWSESRQENRFLKPVQQLQRSLKPKDLDVVLDRLLKNKNRSDLFELEALLRVYESKYPDTLDGFLENDIKPFEDELGKWIDTREAIVFAEKVEAPKELIAYLRGKEESSRDQLKNFIRNKKLSGGEPDSSPISKLEDALAETDWSGKKKDRKTVLKSIEKLLEKVSETKYDLNDLEAGVHEFRRNLRWIPIYLRSFSDLVKLDDEVIRPFKISSDDPILESPYSKLPKPKNPVSAPILFPQIAFLTLNRAIEDLGQAKNIGKMEDLFARGLFLSGSARNKTEAKALAKSLVKKHPSYVPIFQKSKAIHRLITKRGTGLMSQLQQVLEQQKGWKKKDCQSFLKSLKKSQN